jgi:predicted acyl esterase
MMVRSEVIRGRFRDDPSRPEPFTPSKPTNVQLPLQDVLHTFKKGHRIMIHIQSSWFPLVDRNPQAWVDNIYTLDDEAAFAKATHRVYRDADHPTQLQFSTILPKSMAATPKDE